MAICRSLSCIGGFRGATSSGEDYHPTIQPKPFRNVQTMQYTLSPLVGRHSAADKLLVSYRFTIRSGVNVSLTSTDGDSIAVNLSLNEAEYPPAELPAKHSETISIDEIRIATADVGAATIDKIANIGDTLRIQVAKLC
jgi:hypothetical protein